MPLCKATLAYVLASNNFEFKGEHVCRSVATTTVPSVNIEDAVREDARRMAVSDLGERATTIYDRLVQEFSPDGLLLAQVGIDRKTVIQIVNNARRTYFGGDIHGVIEVEPLSSIAHSTGRLPFFQFQTSFKMGLKLERVVGLAHLHLIERMQFKQSSIFVDGTFRCVPKGFYQCVIVMVHDRPTNLFLPVFYLLCTSKKQDVYWRVIDAVVAATDDQLDPAMVVCDFELALMDAVQVQFPMATIVGCYFHLKQAVRRKMVKLSLPKPEIKIAMAKGCLDLLTVIPHNKVQVHGVNYVRHMIERQCVDDQVPYSAAKWNKFWVYFDKTWINRFPPKVWNVHEVPTDIASRTNNPLERYNRTINAKFGSLVMLATSYYLQY